MPHASRPDIFQVSEGISWTLGAILVIVVSVSVGLNVHQRKQLKAHKRSWSLQALLALSSFFVFQLLFDHMFHPGVVPCYITYLFGAIHLPIGALLAIILAYRLHLLFSLERAKFHVAIQKALPPTVGGDQKGTEIDHKTDIKVDKPANDPNPNGGASAGHGRHASDGTELVKRSRRRMKDRYLIGLAILAFIPLFAIGVIAYILDSPETHPDDYFRCRLSWYARAQIAVLVIVVIPLLYIVWQLRKASVDDAFGMREDLKWSMIWTVVTFSLWFILTLTLSRVTEIRVAVEMLFVVMVIGICYRLTLRPALLMLLAERTTSQHPIMSEKNFNFEHFLKSRDGFNFFRVHLQKEFSEENLLAWQAIRNFQARPRYVNLQNIVAKFIRPDAPLQVNLPVDCSRDACSMVDKYDQKGDADVAEAIKEQRAIMTRVSDELFKLMRADSLQRFMRSALWKDYKAGKKAPAAMQTQYNQTPSREESQQAFVSQFNLMSSSGSDGPDSPRGRSPSGHSAHHLHTITVQMTSKDDDHHEHTAPRLSSETSGQSHRHSDDRRGTEGDRKKAEDEANKKKAVEEEQANHADAARRAAAVEAEAKKLAGDQAARHAAEEGTRSSGAMTPTPTDSGNQTPSPQDQPLLDEQPSPSGTSAPNPSDST